MKHAMKSIGEKWLFSLSVAVRTANMRRETRNEKTRDEVQSGAGACCGATRLANYALLPVRGGVRTTPLAPAAESSRVPRAPAHARVAFGRRRPARALNALFEAHDLLQVQDHTNRSCVHRPAIYICDIPPIA